MIQFAKTVALAFLLFFPPFAKSYEIINDVLYSKFDVSKYQLSEIDIKKSLIRTLIEYNWKIIDHSRFKIRATYKTGTVEATIQKDYVDLREVESAPGHITWRNEWMERLEKRLQTELAISYQTKLAESLIPK